MGEVYRAHDSRLKRDVAIKVLPDRFSERFERETRAHRGAEPSQHLPMPCNAWLYTEPGRPALPGERASLRRRAPDPLDHELAEGGEGGGEGVS